MREIWVRGPWANEKSKHLIKPKLKIENVEKEDWKDKEKKHLGLKQKQEKNSHHYKEELFVEKIDFQK